MMMVSIALLLLMSMQVNVLTFAAELAATETEQHLLLAEEHGSQEPKPTAIEVEENCNGLRRLLRGARKLPGGNSIGFPNLGCCPKCAPGSTKYYGHSGTHAQKVIPSTSELELSSPKAKVVKTETSSSKKRRAPTADGHLQSVKASRADPVVGESQGRRSSRTIVRPNYNVDDAYSHFDPFLFGEGGSGRKESSPISISESSSSASSSRASYSSSSSATSPVPFSDKELKALRSLETLHKFAASNPANSVREPQPQKPIFRHVLLGNSEGGPKGWTFPPESLASAQAADADYADYAQDRTSKTEPVSNFEKSTSKKRLIKRVHEAKSQLLKEFRSGLLRSNVVGKERDPRTAYNLERSLESLKKTYTKHYNALKESYPMESRSMTPEDLATKLRDEYASAQEADAGYAQDRASKLKPVSNVAKPISKEQLYKRVATAKSQILNDFRYGLRYDVAGRRNERDPRTAYNLQRSLERLEATYTKHYNALEKSDPTKASRLSTPEDLATQLRDEYAGGVQLDPSDHFSHEEEGESSPPPGKSFEGRTLPSSMDREAAESLLSLVREPRDAGQSTTMRAAEPAHGATLPLTITATASNVPSATATEAEGMAPTSRDTQRSPPSLASSVASRTAPAAAQATARVVIPQPFSTRAAEPTYLLPITATQGSASSGNIPGPQWHPYGSTTEPRRETSSRATQRTPLSPLSLSIPRVRKLPNGQFEIYYSENE